MSKNEEAVDEKPAKNKKQEVVTFYLYDYNDVLDTRTKIIYSPFNVKVKGRLPSEDGFNDPSFVTFVGGVCMTDDPQEIEFLDAWNRGATLSNGKKNFKGDGTHRIKREKPAQLAKETFVKETVEVQVIPMVIAETMTVDQLKQLCKTWKVELPKEFTGEVKSEIVKLLSDSGHVKN